ncbi:MAG TPA: aminodeoxychorismate/anthranilate synthase component II [Thermoanaerobaculia bacterium]
MIVLIDNYDSFTFNLAQLVEDVAGEPVRVVRNDAYDVGALLGSDPSAIVVSPGPGTPGRSGAIVETIRRNTSVPLLGICLGHQAIGEAFGASLARTDPPRHGKVDRIDHAGRNLFDGCPQPLEAARYHSLTIDPSTVPDELEIDASSSDGCIMAVTHRTRPLFGLQFHPESYGTAAGRSLIENFLSLSARWRSRTWRRSSAAHEGEGGSRDRLDN